MKPVPHGEPYAGNLHVRFDEGAGVPDNKGRSALLYTLGRILSLCLSPDEEGEGVCEMALTVSHRPYHKGQTLGRILSENVIP